MMEESPKVEMVRSVKDKPMLLVGEYLFHFDDRTSNGFRWVCSRRKNTLCRVQIFTTLIDETDLTRHKVEKIIDEHIHGPSEQEFILRARQKKRQADAEGLPCILDKKFQRWRSRRQKAGKLNAKKNKLVDNKDEDENKVKDPDATSKLYRHVEDVMDALENPKDGEITKFTFLPSLKGNRILIMNNMIFYHDNRGLESDPKSFWTCLYRLDKEYKCNLRLRTEGLGKDIKIVKVSGKHTHKDNHRQQILKRIKRISKVKPEFADLLDECKIKMTEEFNSLSLKVGTKTNAGRIRTKVNDAITKLYRYVHNVMDVLNNPKDGEITKFTFLPSLQGNRILIMNNMIFHHDCRGPQSDRRSYWTCLYRRNKIHKCKSRLITDGRGNDIKIIKVTGEHKHKDNHRKLILKRIQKNIKSEEMDMFSTDNETDNDNDSLSGQSDISEDALNDIESCENSSDIGDFIELKEPKIEEEIDIMEPTLKENIHVPLVECKKESEMERFGETPPLTEYINIKNFCSNSEDGSEYKPGATKSQSITSAANVGDDENYVSNTKRRISELNPQFNNLLDKHNTEKMEELNPVPLVINRKRIIADDAITRLYRQVDDVMDALQKPKDGEITKFTFLPSLQGNRILIMNKMIFHRNWREPQSDLRCYWTCLYRFDKVYKCKSRLITDGVGKDIKIIKLLNEHSHKRNHREQILKRIKQNIKPKKMEMFPMDGDSDDDDDIDNQMADHTDTPEDAVNDIEFIREDSPDISDFIQLKKPKLEREIDIMEPTLDENAHVPFVECKNESEMNSCHETLFVIDEIKMKSLNASNFDSYSEDKPELNELNPEFADLLGNHETVKMEEFKYSIKLYTVSDSPPSLAVRMCLKALNIPYELNNVDYIASEHLPEEYAKLNPQKENPVLDDDGFHLSESVAIMQYLCDKYAGNDNALYPKDATQRALVNHRLWFNTSFYNSISAYRKAPIFSDHERTEMGVEKVKKALLVFETYLECSSTKYTAGNNVTIADFALVSTTMCLEAIAFNLSGYPLITKWYDTFKKEHADLWSIANAGMQEITEFEHNRVNLSHMNHPLSSEMFHK